MRGRLERAAAVAGVEHLSEGPLEVDGLGGRANRRPSRVPDSTLDRAEQAGPPPGRAKDRVEEKSGGRLSVRAGHACDLELPRWIVEEGDGRLRHRNPGVGHDELDDVELERSFNDQRDGAALHGIPGERMSVVPLAGDTEEKRAGLDGARVVGEVGDLDRSALDDVRWSERFDDALQVHLRGESTNGVSRYRCRAGVKSSAFAAVS